MVQNLIKIDREIKKVKKRVSANQSANYLTHCCTKLIYLFEILENMSFTPRYFIEDISYLKINSKKIAIPMVCFCDIPLVREKTHLENYGYFGLALKKQWGINNKLQKITYVTNNSHLLKDIHCAFEFAMNYKGKEDITPLTNNILTLIQYLKPIVGNQKNAMNELKKIWFTDDCEWRFVSNDELLECIIDNGMTEEEYEEYIKNINIVIAEDTKLAKLKFDIDDIEYIIVDTIDSVFELKRYFTDKNLEQRFEQLVTKIIIWDNIKEVI